MRSRTRFVVATMCALGVAVAVLSVPSVRGANTTADCGRFYLKYSKKRGQMECVNKFTGKTKIKARIRARVREVDLALKEVDRILGQDRVTDADRDRVLDLLTKSQAKIAEIRQRSQQLNQQQQTFQRQLLSQELQRIRQQAAQARRFFRTQRARSRRLLGEQRARQRINAAN